MAVQSSLGYCIDESLGRPLANVLRQLRAPGAPNIHDARDLGLSGASDEVLMASLARHSVQVMVTGDSRMLVASVRRDVWRTSGLTLFMLAGAWGNLSLFDQARGLVWWWPFLVAQANAEPAGTAWRVPVDLRVAGLQRLFEGRPNGTA